MKVTFLIVLILVSKISFSQSRVEKEFDIILDFNEIRFEKSPLVLIEKHDIKRQVSLDTVLANKSMNNIISLLREFDKIKANISDSLISFIDFNKQYLLLEDLYDLSKTKDTLFSSEFIKTINIYKERYICFIIQEGFFSTDEKISNLKGTSILISIITIGMLIPIPVTAISKMQFYVFDKQTKQIIYQDTDLQRIYNKVMPFEHTVTDNQINNLFYRIQDSIKYNISRKRKKDGKKQ